MGGGAITQPQITYNSTSQVGSPYPFSILICRDLAVADFPLLSKYEKGFGSDNVITTALKMLLRGSLNLSQTYAGTQVLKYFLRFERAPELVRHVVFADTSAFFKKFSVHELVMKWGKRKASIFSFVEVKKNKKRFAGVCLYLHRMSHAGGS